MKRFKDWVEIFYPRYLMRCVEINDTVLDVLCLIFKKGLAMHPLSVWLENLQLGTVTTKIPLSEITTSVKT
jgi:hypothetical protein